MYLCNGTPTVKYFSIEDMKTADAIGLQAAMEQSFKVAVRVLGMISQKYKYHHFVQIAA